jgi:hypothetical protein
MEEALWAQPKPMYPGTHVKHVFEMDPSVARGGRDSSAVMASRSEDPAVTAEQAAPEVPEVLEPSTAMGWR